MWADIVHWLWLSGRLGKENWRDDKFKQVSHFFEASRGFAVDKFVENSRKLITICKDSDKNYVKTANVLISWLEMNPWDLK